MKINVDFLNGYILHVMRGILDEIGQDAAGYNNFYAVRVLKTHSPIANYDTFIAEYLITHLPQVRVLHVGSGIGTLDLLLACNGFRVGGIEARAPMVISARRLRGEVIKTWPEVAQVHEIIEGRFPEVTADTPWEAKDVLLVFTNVAGGWDEETTKMMIDRMPRFGRVLLDLERFGNHLTDRTSERDALFDRIAATAGDAARLPPEAAPGYDLALFSF